MHGEGQGQAFSSKFHCSIKTTIKLKHSKQIPGFGKQRDPGSSPHWLTFTFKVVEHCIPTIHEAFTRLTALPILMQNHSDDELSYKLIPSSPPTQPPGIVVPICSVQFKIYIYALKKSTWALPLEEFPQRWLWNGSKVHLADDGQSISPHLYHRSGTGQYRGLTQTHVLISVVLDVHGVRHRGQLRGSFCRRHSSNPAGRELVKIMAVIKWGWKQGLEVDGACHKTSTLRNKCYRELVQKDRLNIQRKLNMTDGHLYSHSVALKGAHLNPPTPPPPQI